MVVSVAYKQGTETSKMLSNLETPIFQDFHVEILFIIVFVSKWYN